jgi:hypothetical protein
MVGVLRRIPAEANRILNVLNYRGDYSGCCDHGNLTCMNTPQEHPRVFVVLRAHRQTTEVRIKVSWRFRISAPAMARLLIIAVLVLVATAFALPAHDELVRDAAYSAAGLLAGTRPRNRS